MRVSDLVSGGVYTDGRDVLVVSAVQQVGGWHAVTYHDGVPPAATAAVCSARSFARWATARVNAHPEPADG